MLDSMATTKPTKRPTAKPATLAEIGREAAKAAQRKALLAELKRQDWNLTATAETLGVASVSNLLRSVVALALEAEYEAAPGAGKIVRGPKT